MGQVGGGSNIYLAEDGGGWLSVAFFLREVKMGMGQAAN